MPADIWSSPVRRVVLVVLDGLRPDAITRFGLHRVAGLARRGASTFRARTVNPSITPCAIASLLTGAAPERHGIQSEHFHLPRPRGPVHPLAK
jgi:predicted AlkP superfamily pyrophosphatase or phosphodiesterase